MVDIFHYPFPLYRLFFCPANRVWGQQDVTLAFGRDCGEYKWPAKEMTLEDMEESDEGIEFIYIFTPEQEWKYCCPVSPDMRWRNVRNELAAESEIFNQNSEEQDCGENCDPVLSM